MLKLQPKLQHFKGSFYKLNSIKGVFVFNLLWQESDSLSIFPYNVSKHKQQI